ncbi:hypothetical protein NHQ30_011364 [Ciborinia camelliae]|nr:hypothetical protein NHQ30_011364 [Ciborinia camelliae]
MAPTDEQLRREPGAPCYYCNFPTMKPAHWKAPSPQVYCRECEECPWYPVDPPTIDPPLPVQSSTTSQAHLQPPAAQGKALHLLKEVGDQKELARKRDAAKKRSGSFKFDNNAEHAARKVSINVVVHVAKECTDAYGEPAKGVENLQTFKRDDPVDWNVFARSRLQFCTNWNWWKSENGVDDDISVPCSFMRKNPSQGKVDKGFTVLTPQKHWNCFGDMYSEIFKANEPIYIRVPIVDAQLCDPDTGEPIGESPTATEEPQRTNSPETRLRVEDQDSMMDLRTNVKPKFISRYEISSDENVEALLDRPQKPPRTGTSRYRSASTGQAPKRRGFQWNKYKVKGKAQGEGPEEAEVVDLTMEVGVKPERNMKKEDAVKGKDGVKEEQERFDMDIWDRTGSRPVLKEISPMTGELEGAKVPQASQRRRSTGFGPRPDDRPLPFSIPKKNQSKSSKREPPLPKAPKTPPLQGPKRDPMFSPDELNIPDFKRPRRRSTREWDDVQEEDIDEEDIDLQKVFDQEHEKEWIRKAFRIA